MGKLATSDRFWVQSACENEHSMTRARKDTLFGSIVVAEYDVSLRDLQEALDKQKSNSELLGNILISMGVLDKEQVLKALHRQIQMRSRAREG